MKERTELVTKKNLLYSSDISFVCAFRWCKYFHFIFRSKLSLIGSQFQTLVLNTQIVGNKITLILNFSNTSS